MLYDKNLVEMSLGLHRSEPIFRKIRELPGIGRRPRTGRRHTIRKKFTNRFQARTRKSQTKFLYLEYY